MSPTPILDRRQPPPAPPRVKRGKWFVIGGVLGLAVPFVPARMLPTSAASPLAVLAVMALVLFPEILWHELGHVAAGFLAGFDFRRLLVGPWTLTREAGGLRFRFQGRRFLAGGHAYMLPLSPEDLRRRYCIFLSGGPLATLGLFLVIALLPKGLVTQALFFTNVILAVSCCIPMVSGGHYTDAKAILILLRNDAAAKRLATMLYLLTLDGQGVPPAEWPAEAVDVLRTAESAKDFGSSARMLFHIYTRETAPPAADAAALERVLAIADQISASQRLAYFSAAAYFHGVTNRDAALARAWLADARAVKGAIAQRDWDATAMAAIAYAEGNEGQFQQERARALQYLDRQPGPSGSLAACRRRVAGLSVTQPVPSMRPPGL